MADAALPPPPPPLGDLAAASSRESGKPDQPKEPKEPKEPKKPKKPKKPKPAVGKGGLVRFGEGCASLELVARDGYDYHAAPMNMEEFELPPVCTLPTLAWDPDTGIMCRASFFHAGNGVFSNAKFDDCTGEIVGISHNWLATSYYIFHQQHPYNTMVPAAALKTLAAFMKALRDPQVDLQFPMSSFQPKRLLAFDPIRRRATKKDMTQPNACRSLHHTGSRDGTSVPIIKPKGPSAAAKRSRPAAPKAALRAAALKAPVSTRIAMSLFEHRMFCNTCNKINSSRLLSPNRSWTISDIVRKFGSKHPFAVAWIAVAKNLTAPVIAGLCIANVTAPAARKLVLQRTGTLVRGPGLYLVLNYTRVNLGGSLKALVATIYADRPNVAAGVLSCYGTKQSVENIYGKLSQLLRDDAVAQTIAEKGRFKFPALLPKAVMQDAEKHGLSQHWWWAAIGQGTGPKPSLSCRWIAVPNRNDPVGSYTIVSAEMWTVLDAIRGGWKINIGLAPAFDPKDLRPNTGANGIQPVHAAYEPTVVKEPYPEVLCGEYITWDYLKCAWKNRRIAVNSADPSKYPPLNITGNWMKAAQGVSLAVPGCKEITVKYGQVFQDLCRLAILFKLDNFKLDLSMYADFEAYSLDRREIVQEQSRQHRSLIRQAVLDSAEGGAYVDKDGIATAERIFQDVFLRA